MRKTTADHSLISRILVDQDFTTPLEEGIKAHFFGQEETQEAWQWISAYRSEYMTLPSIDVFRRKFPTFAVDLAPQDPMRALIDEVYSNHRKRLTAEALTTAISLYEKNRDVDEVLPILQNYQSTLHSETGRSDVQLATDILGRLIVHYVNTEENAMPGIPTGFQIIDDALGGLMPEQLVTLIGLPKRMKSSFLLHIAGTAFLHGYRVGVVSFEMSNVEQQARWLSLNAGVPLTKMQRGLLSEQELQRLYEFEETIEMAVEQGSVGELIFIHDVEGASTVSGLDAQQEKLGLDLLCVDGLYLMTDELGETQGSSQALTHITRATKRMAQNRKIPIVCSTQALFSRTSRARGIEMESIAYTSSFAQDSDVLLGIDRLDMELPISKLKVVAARNALGVECEVAIDYNKGTVEDRGYVTSDFGGKDSDVGGISYGNDD